MLSLIIPLFLGINTPFSYKKLWKFYIISFFTGAYISFIYLIKSSLIYFYSTVSSYLLSLQYAIWCNKNPFKSCLLIFSGLIMAVFYISRLIYFLYFFKQVNAIIAIILLILENKENEGCLIYNWVVIIILQSAKVYIGIKVAVKAELLICLYILIKCRQLIGR